MGISDLMWRTPGIRPRCTIWSLRQPPRSAVTMGRMKSQSATIRLHSPPTAIVSQPPRTAPRFPRPARAARPAQNGKPHAGFCGIHHSLIALDDIRILQHLHPSKARRRRNKDPRCQLRVLVLAFPLQDWQSGAIARHRATLCNAPAHSPQRATRIASAVLLRHLLGESTKQTKVLWKPIQYS